GLDEPAECLERGHPEQVDRDVLGGAVRRQAVNDLDVKARQMRGRAGRFWVVGRVRRVGHGSPPWRCYWLNAKTASAVRRMVPIDGSMVERVSSIAAQRRHNRDAEQFACRMSRNLAATRSE